MQKWLSTAHKSATPDDDANCTDKTGGSHVAARRRPLRFLRTNNEMDHAVRRGNEEAVKVFA